MSTGMEKKENEGTSDIFWSREPIMGHRGTKENPAIVPSYNTSRCVGLETEQVRKARARRYPLLTPARSFVLLLRRRRRLTSRPRSEQVSWVINKQGPNRQIWWSSPLSGPRRYEYEHASDRWLHTRDGSELLAQLRAELLELGGVTLDLGAS